MAERTAPGGPLRFARAGRVALVALVVAAAGLLVARLLLGFFSYPLSVSTPDLSGVVASRSTNQFDSPEVRLLLTSGDEVILHRDDRSLIGGVGEGDLIVFGTAPEHWYLRGSRLTRLDGLDCYGISADRAYSESDGIVLVWGAWLGQGIRLERAPGYDDDDLLYEIFGHREYRQFELGSGVSFCLDAKGRVTQFTH
jgi:hypothetical protein